MKLNIYLYLLCAILLTNCKPDIEESGSPTAGNANFSKFVAVGNSLTAGYADGALYKSGQTYGFTNIMAQQFALVGGGAYKIPYIEDENGIGFAGTTPVTKRVLKPVTDCKGVTSLSPVFAGSPNLSALGYIGNQGPFNNLGVPGVKSFQTLSPLLGNPSGGNPFYVRIASNPGVSTLIGDAVSQSPTFISLWLGNNDVLGYAISGGEEGPDSVTTGPAYNQYINLIANQLFAGGAKGVIANIPDVTLIPYFNTVPYNGLVLTDQNQVNQLNAGYKPFGITFNLGQNPFIIADKNAPGGRRQIKSDELILLTIPQDSIKCFGWGSQTPIPGQYVLDQNEISIIKSAITSYNQSISTLAANKNLALADINQLITNLKSGLSFNSLTFNTQFVTGGAFSLDGIHLTPRGNAVVANYFIDAINQKYEAKVPKVIVSNYPGISIP